MLIITEAVLLSFCTYLMGRAYSKNTISKYLHDARVLMAYAPEGIADRAHLAGFPAYLEEKGYRTASINSMLGAVNVLLRFLGSDWQLQYCKVQSSPFLPPEKELSRGEYEDMVRAAERQGNERLALLAQTLGATGIRISELSAITAESLKAGEATIQNKGKCRTILLPDELIEKLTAYCAERRITAGPVFITRTGKPMDRSNIWKMFKKLAETAKVLAKKVFPHNFRHLFARIHYEMHKDLAHLADLLGHSSVNTTRIYTARSSAEERRQLGQLGLVL